MVRIFMADMIVSIWHRLFDYLLVSLGRLRIMYEFIIRKLLGGKQ